MTSEKILSGITNAEHELLLKIKKGKEGIFCLASDGDNSIVHSSSVNASPTIMLLGRVSCADSFCIGNISNKKIEFGLGDNKGFIRAIIDTRDQNDMTCYFHYNGKTAMYCSDNKKSDDLMFAYTETHKFAHFILFDGRVERKMCEIFFTSIGSINQLRTVVFSVAKRTFPELDLGLSDDSMEVILNGEEK